MKKCKGRALGQGAIPGIFTSCLSLQSHRNAEMWSGTHSQPDPYQTDCPLAPACHCLPFLLLLVVAKSKGMARAAREEQHKLLVPLCSIRGCLDYTPSLPLLTSSLTSRSMSCVLVLQVNSFVTGLAYLKIGTHLGLRSVW